MQILPFLFSGEDNLEVVVVFILTSRCYINCQNFVCYLKGRVISNGKEVGFILYLFLKEIYTLYCVPQAFFPYFSSLPVFFLIAWMAYGIIALLSFIWLSPAGSCIWAPDPWPQLLLNLCEASKRFNKRPEKWVIFVVVVKGS